MKTRTLANFLCVYQNTFYEALSRLHSVLEILELKVFHTSLKHNHSGKFCIEAGGSNLVVRHKLIHIHEWTIIISSASAND
jgi:hypothetical protein